MKKKSFKLLSLLLVISLLFSSCSAFTGKNADNISDKLIGCTWEYKLDASFTETLVFHEDGTVTYESDDSSGGFTEEGTWKILDEGIIQINYGAEGNTEHLIDFKLVDDNTLKAHPGDVVYHKVGAENTNNDTNKTSEEEIDIPLEVGGNADGYLDFFGGVYATLDSHRLYIKDGRMYLDVTITRIDGSDLLGGGYYSSLLYLRAYDNYDENIFDDQLNFDEDGQGTVKYMDVGESKDFTFDVSFGYYPNYDSLEDFINIGLPHVERFEISF